MLRLMLRCLFYGLLKRPFGMTMGKRIRLRQALSLSLSVCTLKMQTVARKSEWLGAMVM